MTMSNTTLTERFWQWLARQLSRRVVFDFLFAIARRSPYKHIFDKEFRLYMGRWWVLKERAWFPWAARLHHITRPDNERHLHDHPYDFRTLILQGAYDEVDIFGNYVPRQSGTSYARRAHEYHRIVAMGAVSGAWTLFIYRHRKVSNPWGFLVDNDPTGVRKVHWREYLNEPKQD